MRFTTRVAVLAAVASMAAAGQIATAQADFGVAPKNFSTTVTGGAPGPTATQAGGHPDFTTTFSMNRRDPDDPSLGPDGTIRNLDLDLPRGFVANPTVVDQCTVGRILDYTGTREPCPATAAVGYADVRLYDPVNPTIPIHVINRVYRINPEPGEAAAFAFKATFFPVRLGATVGPNGGYRIRASVRDLTEAQPLIDSKVVLWGVPADHQGPGDLNEGYQFDGFPGFGPAFNGPLEGAERKSFVSVPGRCDGGPLTSTLTLSSWQTGAPIAPVETNAPAPSGCDQLHFDPGIAMTPANAKAGQPSGYTVDLTVPQTTAADDLSTPNLKDAVVTLPAGAAISPPAAGGLDACTDAQLALTSNGDETCPPASKIGSVSIVTPLLDDPVAGSLYVGEQLSNDPESGQMYRLFLTATADGVKVKLRGTVRADKQTGQLTASFLDNPQVPFSKFSLTFKDGDRSILVNPSECGTYMTKGSLTSWGGQARDVTSSFVINQDCPTGKFAPTFTAGTTNPLAGSYSPFSMTVVRTDADRNLSNIKVDLPSGLLGALGSVPLCGEAQAAAGTCGATSRIGSTTVSAGSGGQPYSLGGTVSLAGPYKGAPFSLSVAVPAKAGPFNLGLVVVRAALYVDANNARASAVSDPFPTIVGGVPIKLRMVNIALDRPGFIFNATRCQPMAITGTFGSVGGGTATSSVAYQAKGCDMIKVSPKLSLEYKGRTQLRKGKHPGVEANLADTFGQSGLKSVQVKLPLTASLDPDNARALCEAAAAAARNCPAASQIGWASATTPALHEPVQGPVYFVKGTRVTAAGKAVPTLPKLYLKLSGEGVTVDLRADSDVDSKKRLVTTFTDIPDVPIRDFKLTINSGKHGILEATNDVCGAEKGTTVVYTGHNGGTTERNLRFTAPDCKPQIMSAVNSNNATLAVRLGGIGAGKVVMTGSGIGRATRTVNDSDTALVRARFSAGTIASLRRKKPVRVPVRVVYTPRRGKVVHMTKVVTIKAGKR